MDSCFRPMDAPPRSTPIHLDTPPPTLARPLPPNSATPLYGAALPSGQRLKSCCAKSARLKRLQQARADLAQMDLTPGSRRFFVSARSIIGALTFCRRLA